MGTAGSLHRLRIPSICLSSSAVSLAALSAFTFSSICSTRLAPISAEVTRGSRNTHVSASWASDCPRARASVLRSRLCSRRRA